MTATTRHLVQVRRSLFLKKECVCCAWHLKTAAVDGFFLSRLRGSSSLVDAGVSRHGLDHTAVDDVLRLGLGEWQEVKGVETFATSEGDGNEEEGGHVLLVAWYVDRVLSATTIHYASRTGAPRVWLFHSPFYVRGVCKERVLGVSVYVGPSAAVAHRYYPHLARSGNWTSMRAAASFNEKLMREWSDLLLHGNGMG